MKPPLRALIIENVEDDALLIADTLSHDFDVKYRRVDTPEETRVALTSEIWHVILSDYLMPGYTALDAFSIYSECGLDTPFIIVSGSVGEDIAVGAMRTGVHDYLLKDRMSRLPEAVKRELREAENRRLLREAEEERVNQSKELARRAKQLERLNEDLERFAMIAAHDLQEPLRMINAYSELLVKSYRGIDPTADKFVGYITGGVRRMESLIRGLLEYSVRSSDPGSILKKINVDEILNEIVNDNEQFARAVIERDVRLKEISGNAPVIRRVLFNLILNAVKYVKPGEMPRVRITVNQKQGDAIFCVNDEGIGIAPEYHEVIFEVFRRLHTQAEIPGLGLGLALSRRLIENQGGRMWIESRAGHGASFFFSIPQADSGQSGGTNSHHQQSVIF